MVKRDQRLSPATSLFVHSLSLSALSWSLSHSFSQISPNPYHILLRSIRWFYVVYPLEKLKIRVFDEQVGVERRRMESTSSEKEVGAAATASSYTYWVREVREDAAPLPLPKKLDPHDLSNHSQHPPSHLGSVWNRVLSHYSHLSPFSELSLVIWIFPLLVSPRFPICLLVF